MSRTTLPDLAGAVRRLEERGWAEIATPRALRDAIIDLSAAADWFFAQDEADKLEFDIRQSRGHRGYVPVEEQGGYGDEGERRYEAFDIGRDELPTDTMRHPLRGVNRWPSWPEFGHAAERGFAVFASLAADLGRAICDHLVVKHDEFEKFRSEPVSQLRLIRYGEPSEIDLREAPAAMGAHTDYEFFTLFHQSEAGLEILDPEGRWIETKSGVDTLGIMAGDLLEVFSGGRIRSTMHRASGAVVAGRTTIPFFCGADFYARVVPVTGGSREELAFGDHLMRQLRRDFPYLRDTLVHEPRGEQDALIDLTESTPFDRLSDFEQRRLGEAGQVPRERRS